MKKTIVFALAAMCASGAFAQNDNKKPEGFEFTTIKEIPIVPRLQCVCMARCRSLREVASTMLFTA